MAQPLDAIFPPGSVIACWSRDFRDVYLVLRAAEKVADPCNVIRVNLRPADFISMALLAYRIANNSNCILVEELKEKLKINEDLM